MCTQDYEVGMRVLNISTGKAMSGKEGTVTEVSCEGVSLNYGNGSSGFSNNPNKYYKIITQSNTTTKPMDTLINFAKNLVLTSDEKVMRKYGLKNECGDFTELAKQVVINKLCADNVQTLIDLANAKAADDKENK